MLLLVKNLQQAEGQGKKKWKRSSSFLLGSFRHYIISQNIFRSKPSLSRVLPDPEVFCMLKATMDPKATRWVVVLPHPPFFPLLLSRIRWKRDENSQLKDSSTGQCKERGNNKSTNRLHEASEEHCSCSPPRTQYPAHFPPSTSGLGPSVMYWAWHVVILNNPLACSGQLAWLLLLLLLLAEINYSSWAQHKVLSNKQNPTLRLVGMTIRGLILATSSTA